MITIGPFQPGETFSTSIPIAGIGVGDLVLLRVGPLSVEFTGADGAVVVALTGEQTAQLQQYRTFSGLVQYRADVVDDWAVEQILVRTGEALPGVEAVIPGATRGLLSDLIDVDAESPDDGEVLTWDADAARWVPGVGGGGGGPVAASDVTATAMPIGIISGANVQALLGSTDTALSTASSERIALAADITTAEGNITTLQADVTAAEGDITTLQADVTAAEGAIVAIQSDITTDLDPRITALEDELGTNESTYWVNLDRIAARFKQGRCRLCVIGDSVTQNTGASGDSPATARFCNAIPQYFKPDHWIGGDPPAAGFNVSGVWRGDRPALTGVTHSAFSSYINPGQTGSPINLAATTRPGFHCVQINSLSIADTTGVGIVARTVLSAGGDRLSVSWRNAAGAHRLLVQGAVFEWRPYWFIPGAATFADGQGVIREIGMNLDVNGTGFAWSSITEESFVPATPEEPWRTVLASGRCRGTLSTAPADIDTAGKTWPNGPQLAVRAPGNAAWSTIVTSGSSRLLLGGMPFERVDTPNGAGIYVGQIAFGGWATSNHAFEPPEATDCYIDEGLVDHLAHHRFDTFMIYLGTNDAAGVVSSADYAYRVRRIIERVRNAHRAARARDLTIQDFHLVILTPVAANTTTGREATMRFYWDAVEPLAGGDVSIIRIGQQYDDEVGDVGVTYWGDGGIHPTQLGAEAVLTRVWNQILDAGGF